MEMGYFASISEEDAAPILGVNPEDPSSMALQNTRKISYFTWYRNQNSTTQSSSKLRTQCC